MPVNSTKYKSHRFFRNTKPLSITTNGLDTTPVFVDVGGNGDCGFRAVAAGLIDNVSVHPRGHGDLLNTVLMNHFSYFPKQRPTTQGLATVAERMQQLINYVGMETLLQSLAYTLRQLAVTEMCAHPELYRGAFVERNERTTPADMRMATTWIDESSIAALAKAISLPIEVLVVERNKTLPMRLHYNPTDAGIPPVVIQLQNSHYTPLVSSSDRFNSVNSRPMRALSLPVTNRLAQDRSLSEIHADIAAEDKRLVEVFDDTYHRLAATVRAGELKKDDLLAIYVRDMTNSDYLTGRVACVGLEHGNQNFFDAIFGAQRGTQRETLPTGNHDQQITAELVHALARAITIGQMTADAVFAHIEDKQGVGVRQGDLPYKM